MSENYHKGLLFENLVQKKLIEHSIEFKRQYRIKGLGKSWQVDFYLYNSKEHNTLLECKNVGKNLIHMISAECVKFLDIRNLSPCYNFMIVFPTLEHGINSLTKFCSVYHIKLSTIDTLIEALRTNIIEQNIKFSLSNIQKVEHARRCRILELLKEKDGLNLLDIGEKLELESNLCYWSLRRLEKEGFIIGVRKRHQDKKYYVKTSTLHDFLP